MLKEVIIFYFPSNFKFNNHDKISKPSVLRFNNNEVVFQMFQYELPKISLLLLFMISGYTIINWTTTIRKYNNYNCIIISLCWCCHFLDSVCGVFSFAHIRVFGHLIKSRVYRHFLFGNSCTFMLIPVWDPSGIDWREDEDLVKNSDNLFFYIKSSA